MLVNNTGFLNKFLDLWLEIKDLLVGIFLWFDGSMLGWRKFYQGKKKTIIYKMELNQDLSGNFLQVEMVFFGENDCSSSNRR